MAVISCPECGKKISDKAEQCNYCGFGMDIDAEQMQSHARKRNNQKIQQLSNHSMVAMVIFLAGFWVMYFQAPEPDSLQMQGSQFAIALGFFWYIVNRIRLLMLKHANKNL